jgi:hypothetical protein
MTTFTGSNPVLTTKTMIRLDNRCTLTRVLYLTDIIAYNTEESSVILLRGFGENVSKYLYAVILIGIFITGRLSLFYSQVAELVDALV